MNNDVYLIVKAYVNYAGIPKYDEKIFTHFVNDFPDILKDYSKYELRQSIKKYASMFTDDVDPVIDINTIKNMVLANNNEIDYFLKNSPKRLRAFVDYFKNFPFTDYNNKTLIRKAILTVYGQDITNPEKAMETNLDNQLTNITEDTAIKDKSENINTPAKSDDVGSETLPPELEEQAVHTLNSYLQKDVFNNKIIPIVKIVEAWKLQNGYAVNFELSSIDNSVKAYALAVIYNDKLVLPAELRDKNDEVLGEFNKESILKIFEESEGSTIKDTNNYGDLLNQMLKSKSPAKASAILDRIIKKFGADVGRNAFDTFVRVKYKKPVISVNRGLLDVRIASAIAKNEYDEILDPEIEKILNRIREDQ